MKKLTRYLTLATFATLLGVASAPSANAQSDRENSTFAVTEPLEVGGYTLQPGTYLIKVVTLTADRNTIKITNVEETEVFALVLATPHPIRTDEMVPSTRYTFYQTTPGQPKALRTWFPRDSTNGQDIVYPKRRAAELAAAAKEPVATIPDTVKEADYKTAPITVVTPGQTARPREEPVMVAQKAPERAPVAVAEADAGSELPRTASRVPLYAALGLLSLGAAFGLRTFANRTA